LIKKFHVIVNYNLTHAMKQSVAVVLGMNSS